MANPKKRKKVLVFSGIGAVLVILTLVAIFKKREPVITVLTEKVMRTNITETVVANGRIQPVLQVMISAEVSGEITELPVKEGQNVKKGDLLVKIKPDVYIAAVNQAKALCESALAGQAQAVANLEKAKADYIRNKDLFEHKLLSESDYIGYKAAYEVAKAQLESSLDQVENAKAQVASAQDSLDKTTITSPLTGTVSKLSLQLGERVAGNTMMAGTEIMTVADLNNMEARVDVGEVDVILLAKGQKANLEVDAFGDRKFNGTVTDIANSSGGIAASSSSSSSSSSSGDATKFQVKIRIDEKESFRPGMSVTAEIETRSRTNVLSVPVQSVTTRPPKPKELASAGKSGKSGDKGTNHPAAVDPPTNSASATTNVVTEAGKRSSEARKPIEVVFVVDGDHVKMVPVKRGINDDANSEIIEGLSEGQEVVSGGYKVISRELEDGKKIRKDKPGSKTNEKKPEQN
jgi:HlyD family secretion protein